MYKGKERRKSKRIEQPFMARFRVKSQKDRTKVASEYNRIAILNLGEKGLLFYCTEKVKKNSILDMRINLSITKPPIKCAAKALRIEKLPKHEMFLVGAAFTKISAKDKKLINKTAKI